MHIIYTSLVKLPLPVISFDAALAQIYQYVEKPPALDNVKSEIHLIDEYHINIVRTFVTVNDYSAWIFSDARNAADNILMKNGFYLYTKQAHI